MIWTNHQIELVFSCHFQEFPTQVEKICHGRMNSTYEVILKNEAFILKVFPESRFGIARKQFLLLSSITDKNVKIPKVSFWGRANETSYLIYKKIPGQMLDFNQLEVTDKLQISQQIAENIKALSQISFGRVGCLTEDEPPFKKWITFLKVNVHEGCKYLRLAKLIPDKDIVKLEIFLWKISEELSFAKVGLVWSDFSQDNIIIQNNKLSGFVDFESCFAGDPLLSLGYLFAREGESEFYLAMEKEFLNVFISEKRYIYFYALLRLLRISKYLSEPMPNGQQRDFIFDYFKGLKKALEYFIV